MGSDQTYLGLNKLLPQKFAKPAEPNFSNVRSSLVAGIRKGHGRTPVLYSHIERASSNSRPLKSVGLIKKRSGLWKPGLVWRHLVGGMDFGNMQGP